VGHADQETTTDTSPVESVDRALLALQALAQAVAHGIGLAELAVEDRVSR